MDETTGFEMQTEENWTLLADLANVKNPLFERILFLFGYDFSSNTYLIQGDYLSIIDPGNDYTAFMQLVDLGFKPPDIKKIAVTHGHHDHVMGAVELFRGYRGFDNLEFEIIMHEAGPKEFKEMMRRLGCQITEVKGGETINLSGFDLEVIYTPGHTIDGLCFYHAPTRTMFTGDTVLPHSMAGPDTKVAGGRMDHYFYAVRTLLKRDIDHVLPGHGGVAPNIGRWVVEETYDGLIKKMVGVETPHLEGATTLAQDGLLEEALFYVNKELTKEPESAEAAEALEFKAFLLNDLGRVEEALEVFDQVLTQQPDRVEVLMGKGTALLGMGRYDESLALFSEALGRQPQLPEAQIYKGMALYLSGRVEEALELPAFQQEFASRLKEELEKLAQDKGVEITS
jgi:glyoxylase-like metal-dependent hydrolase (beta-lactamase superfamily II)